MKATLVLVVLILAFALSAQAEVGTVEYPFQVEKGTTIGHIALYFTPAATNSASMLVRQGSRNILDPRLLPLGVVMVRLPISLLREKFRPLPQPAETSYNPSPNPARTRIDGTKRSLSEPAIFTKIVVEEKVPVWCYLLTTISLSSLQSPSTFKCKEFLGKPAAS